MYDGNTTVIVMIIRKQKMQFREAFLELMHTEETLTIARRNLAEAQAWHNWVHDLEKEAAEDE